MDLEFVTNVLTLYMAAKAAEENFGRVTPRLQIVGPERHTGAQIVTPRHDYLF